MRKTHILLTMILITGSATLFLPQTSRASETNERVVNYRELPSSAYAKMSHVELLGLVKQWVFSTCLTTCQTQINSLSVEDAQLFLSLNTTVQKVVFPDDLGSPLYSTQMNAELQ